MARFSTLKTDYSIAWLQKFEFFSNNIISQDNDIVNSSIRNDSKNDTKIKSSHKDSDYLKAVESGKVAKYVTDFPTENMLNRENIIAIPHLGASTPESEDNCAVMAANELMDYLENGNIVNSVNFPRCSMERSTPVRICIFHKNIPNMIGQISKYFAEKDVNIENMINKSRGDYAYTMLDVDHEPAKDDISFEGVKWVRVIK